MKVSIGADPELFAFEGDKPVSVHNLLPGSKHFPMKVPRGAIQVDGVAAEFNIDPCSNSRSFLKNIKHVRGLMQKILNTKNPNLKLVATPTAVFSEEYFKDLPTEAKALGCEPDYNAYTREPNPKPETDKPMRTGSGHVHIGWDTVDLKAPNYIDTVCGLVKELDFVLYRQSFAWDNDYVRQELYGKPGAFRFKPYGLEYRVLSNKWLDNDATINFIFDATKNVTERFLRGERFVDNYANQCSTVEYYKSRKLPVVSNYI
jgi:hypothetical protein